MKYVSVITDYTYLLWQQEIQAFNLKKLGILDQLVVVVLYEPGTPLSEQAKGLADKVETHYFENDQPRRHYIPSNKPWGLMKLLRKRPDYGRRVFLLDSDVIFREPLDFTKLDGIDGQDLTWYVSDTRGYIAHHYLQEMLDDEGTDEMAKLVGLTGERLKEEQTNSGGAQYYMKNVTAAFCRQVTEDSIKIYDWALAQKRDNGSYKIQVWTAEMWAWLWNGFRVADVKVSSEMDFAWAPHHISDWHAKKMMHLAGVTGGEPGGFFKGKYSHVNPWDQEKNFWHVDRTRCWTPYVELIEEYKGMPPKPARRAIAAYVDDVPSLIGQTKCLFESLKHIQAEDTDLVAFGPAAALEKLPNHPQLVKVVQPPHRLAKEYGFINSIYCLNGPGSEVLDNYEYVLKSDVDTFLTPAWNQFHPTSFTCGQGLYSNSDRVRDNCRLLAQRFGLNHHGRHNLGSTLYGNTQKVRAVGALATTLCEHLLEVEFKADPGAWPDWYRGVSSMYATEVALNHLVAGLDGPNRMLDYYSTSTDPVETAPHIHCWHTNEPFSKFIFEAGLYDHMDIPQDISQIRSYCLAMALRSKRS